MVKKVIVDGRYVDRLGTGISLYTKEFIRVMALCPEIDLTVLDTRDGCVNYHKKIITGYPVENHTTSLLWYSFFLQKMLKKDGFDIFHSPAFNLPITSFIKKTVTIHDLTPFKVPKTMSKKFSLYLKWAIINSIRTADKIIAVSKSVKSELIEIFGEKARKKTVVWNPLYKDITQKPFRDFSKSPYILFVGQDNPRKNLKLLIKTFSEIREQLPELSLKIVGVGPDERENVTGVEHLGYIDNVQKEEMYEKALVFVYPSLYEGFGIPIHEAFYHESPVLAADIPVFRETAGEAALYFKLNNTKDFKDKLILLLQNPGIRNDLIKKGLKRLREYKEAYCPEYLWKIFLGL